MLKQAAAVLALFICFQRGNNLTPPETAGCAALQLGYYRSMMIAFHLRSYEKGLGVRVCTCRICVSCRAVWIPPVTSQPNSNCSMLLCVHSYAQGTEPSLSSTRWTGPVYEYTAQTKQQQLQQQQTPVAVNSDLPGIQQGVSTIPQISC